MGNHQSYHPDSKKHARSPHKKKKRHPKTYTYRVTEEMNPKTVAYLSSLKSDKEKQIFQKYVYFMNLMKDKLALDHFFHPESPSILSFQINDDTVHDGLFWKDNLSFPLGTVTDLKQLATLNGIKQKDYEQDYKKWMDSSKGKVIGNLSDRMVLSHDVYLYTTIQISKAVLVVKIAVYIVDYEEKLIETEPASSTQTNDRWLSSIQYGRCCELKWKYEWNQHKKIRSFDEFLLRNFRYTWKLVSQGDMGYSHPQNKICQEEFQTTVKQMVKLTEILNELCGKELKVSTTLNLFGENDATYVPDEKDIFSAEAQAICDSLLTFAFHPWSVDESYRWKRVYHEAPLKYQYSLLNES